MLKRIFIPALVLGSLLVSCEKSELETLGTQDTDLTPTHKVTANATDKDGGNTATGIEFEDDIIFQDETKKDDVLEELEELEINIKEVSDGDDEADDGDDS